MRRPRAPPFLQAQTADIGLIAQATGLQDTLGKSFKGTLFCPSTTAVRAWLKSRGVTSAAQLSAQDLPVYKAVAQTQIVANAVKKPTVGEKLKSDQVRAPAATQPSTPSVELDIDARRCTGFELCPAASLAGHGADRAEPQADQDHGRQARQRGHGLQVRQGMQQGRRVLH